jgi:hypothetical protein
MDTINGNRVKWRHEKLTISYSDFKELSRERQKETLEALRKEVGVSELIKIWGVSRSKLYNMIHEFDLSVSSKGNKSKPKPKLKKSLKEKMQSDPARQEMENNKDDSAVIQPNVFSMSLNAEGTFKNVSEKLQFLFQQNIVPDTNVRISLNIDEI